MTPVPNAEIGPIFKIGPIFNPHAEIGPILKIGPIFNHLPDGRKYS